MEKMPTCTVSVDDVYGPGWWEKNRDKVLAKWRVEFRMGKKGDRAVNTEEDEVHLRLHTPIVPHLIILGPARPTLMEMYGVDRVTIPDGYTWNGDVRCNAPDEWVLKDRWCVTIFAQQSPRLILRRTEPKVWFKAEEKERHPKIGEWAWKDDGWKEVKYPSNFTWLCATRHEELTPAYTLTQADLEAKWAK